MPISRVGATNGTAVADSTVDSVTRSVAAGNGGILAIASHGAAAVTVGTVSDGVNTWLQAPSIAANSGTVGGDLWYCKQFQTTASITVNITWAAGASATGASTLIEVTGQDTATFFDVGKSTAAITASCASGATASLAGSNEFVVGVVCGNGNNTFTSPAFSPNGTITSETVANSTTSGHKCQVAAFDMVGGTGGATESFTVTDSASTNTITICAAFLPSAAASPQGKVTRQTGRGPAAAVRGRTQSISAAPVPARPGRQAGRGRPAAVRGSTRAAAAAPVPARSIRVIVRAAVNYARPGRVTVIRSTGAGTTPPPPVITAMADDGDAPWHIRIRRRRT